MQDDKSEIERIVAQENGLTLGRFTPDDAWWLGSRLYERAHERSAPVAIEIFVGSTRRFSVSLPGATGDNAAWVKRKIAVSWRFEQSSHAVALRLKSGQNLFERYGLDYRTHAAAGGAVPIKVDGVGMIGVVAVSGLPRAEDHELVIEALAALKAHQADTN
jgi:uncharacterized protein (UPF0303 family)